MPYRATIDAQKAIIEVVYSGVVSGQELTEASRVGVRMQKAAGVFRALADFSAVQRVDFSLVPVFDLPHAVYEQEGASRQLQITVLIPPIDELIELAGFYETACLNRGWRVRVFRARDEAMRWLLEAGGH